MNPLPTLWTPEARTPRKPDGFFLERGEGIIQRVSSFSDFLRASSFGWAKLQREEKNLLEMKRRDLSQDEEEQCDLVELSIANSEEVDPEEKHIRSKTKQAVTGLSKPWFGWLFTYTVVLLFFSIYRYKTLDALIVMYGSPGDCTLDIKIDILTLGFLEDFVCATYFVCTLWVFDIVKRAASEQCRHQGGRQHAAFVKRKRIARLVSKIATFFVSWFLFMTMMTPFVSDMLLVRLRELRFTIEIFVLAYNNIEYISAAPISKEEFHEGYAHGALMILVATLFAIMRARSRWADLSRWNPTHLVLTCAASRSSDFPSESDKQHNYEKIGTQESPDCSAMSKPPKVSFDDEPDVYLRVSQTAIVLVALVAFPMFVLGVSSSCSTLIAYSALNAALDQLFNQALVPTPEIIKRQKIDPRLLDAWAETYIHYQTEEHELFDDNSLYRLTKGFHGDLAFDVDIDPENPPNVILFSVESFRYHDSHYIVGKEDPSNLFKGSNITVTPNFDRWAKRGVSFRNMWSSSPSSRSLESVLFAQVPYENVAKTGIAGGRNDTKLFGIPHLFSAKGYETYFHTGSMLNYDDWDTFLPTHGFDTVFSCYDVMSLAERDLSINPEQWSGDDKRSFPWGVHDDINFHLLGDLMVNRTKEQRERLARGEPKRPMFLMEYSTSSHEPFYARPRWYDESEKPDFSVLYDGLDRYDQVKNYLEMRYFTDVELGKFMDRMETEGVLNDTIVVIFGDHGRGPEMYNSDLRDVSVTRVPTTIIAEGRLGDSVGLVIDDVAEHYDFLNTLADITGVPEGGFVQDGIGRSLKRKIPYGEHVVFSNNPSRKMSVVRGHQRLQYDRVADSLLLHDVDADHDMQVDLFPNLTTDEQTKWLAWRDIGRDISRYYLERWDGKCLLAVNCTDS
ncbi:unnamed protein product [Phytophthora fragariaefolia]|uniref:Unnamed protein product n=1 Tax=Phytophthora fragariaefolia TaxID=1490495 RepID=A0A9W6WUY6_9STRA|nr:unnamed protein product [Phytophthora fragariaefolia]